MAFSRPPVSSLWKTSLKKQWTQKRNYRSSSFLSPLASAFNATQLSGTSLSAVNPLTQNIGLFGIPELTHKGGFEILQEECIRNTKELMEEVCQPRSKRNRLVARTFDDLSDELCRVADMTEFVRLAHPKADWQKAAESACINISGLVEELNTHVGLYESLRDVCENGDVVEASDVDKHVGELFLSDFTQSGIHLPEDKRKYAVELNDYILQLGQQYSAGVQTPRVINRSTIPSNMWNLFPSQGDKIICNGVDADSPYEMAREASYKIYYWHSNEQEELLQKLLAGRNQLSKLCGFESFAQKSMMYSLADNPEFVERFLKRLSESLQPMLAEDYISLFNVKKNLDPLTEKLSVWDIPYTIGHARSEWFKLKREDIAEYFSLGVCMEGLNTIFKELYAVELEVVPAEKGEIWHPTVYKVIVKDVASAEELGTIYCDFFWRESKPMMDCHFVIRGGRERRDGSYQNPAVVLMLNFQKPTWKTPTLLSAGQIDNLFHEMGHAIHSMLARTKYQHVTGTRCSTDFAEVPSTLMEFFSSDPRVVARMSKHYKTGESLDMETVERFVASKKPFSAVEINNQMIYAKLDQVYHAGPLAEGTSTTDIYKDVYNAHHDLPNAPGYVVSTALQHRFGHIVGYGSRYYSYLMARSVASSIWQKYFQEEPYNSDAGMAFRTECLQHGGGKPSYQMVADFLRKDPTAEDLADSVVSDVIAKNESVKHTLKEDW